MNKGVDDDSNSSSNKDHALVAKTFDLRSSLKKQSLLSYNEALDVCHEFTKDQVCPHSSESFSAKKNNLLHADSAGLDIRVAPPSIWMSPTTARITVIDEDNSTQHGSAFLSNFSYNKEMKYFATEKVVHTGVFDIGVQTGSHVTVNIGNEINLPVRTIKPNDGVRMLFWGDPCFSSEWVGCEWGKKWGILNKTTQLLNTLAKQKDSLDVYGLVGDNFYDPQLKLAPQFFNQLNMNALGTFFLTTPGNHDYLQHGGCSHFTGTNTLGSAYLQYYGQNTKASYEGGAANPFNWTGYDAEKLKPIDVSNVVSYTQVGNAAFIIYSGANTKEETMPFFEEACSLVEKQKPAVTFVFSHWSAVNCFCQEGMNAKAVREFLVTSVDGCKQNEKTILSLEGHSHDNKIVAKNSEGAATGFRFGGTGMSELLAADFGVPFIDTHEGYIQVYYFPIADVVNDGSSNWETLMECVTTKGGLHQCTHLAKTFLKQKI